MSHRGTPQRGVMSIEAGLAYFRSLAEWRGNLDFSLENILKVFKHFGNPQDKLPAVQIAGTNGKGSVSCAIASILGASGKRVGLNTSPHLSSINERLVIDGFPASDEFFAKYALRLKQGCEATGVTLSMFEGIMAIGALGFLDQGLDWAVLEVGLGGRLDATTSVSLPKVGAIVTIDFDHMDLLGNTLPKIAAEKAGIIKPGMNLVTGKIDPEPLSVIERVARENNARQLKFGEDYWFEDTNRPTGTFSFRSRELGDIDFRPALPGLHQAHNMAVAIAMGRVLGISLEDCKAGVENAFWPGRIEKTYLGSREVIIDCAHNPAGISSLVQYLKNNKFQDLTLATGMLKGRDWKTMLSALLPYCKEVFLLRPDTDRALPIEEMQEFLRELGISNQTFGKDYAAFVEQAESGTNSLLITGSMYLVGPLRGMICKQVKPLWKLRK